MKGDRGHRRKGLRGLTLLRSVSVNLAELRRAPGAGGGEGIFNFKCLILDWRRAPGAGGE